MTAAVCSALILAQAPPDASNPPAFEVASIKRNTSGNNAIGGPGDRGASGMFKATNIPLLLLMRQAFGRWQNDEIVGGPEWMTTDRWDIAAKADAPSGSMMERVRTLLGDRFKLVTHHETRELPIYALVVARRDGKLGPSLRPSTESSRFRIGFGVFAGRAAMATLVPELSGAIQRIVVDRTGLSGMYEIDLHWTPEGPAAGIGGSDAPPPLPSDAPSIFTAVQEQLGLKLESTKGPVDVLVLDHVERPAED